MNTFAKITCFLDESWAAVVMVGSGPSIENRPKIDLKMGPKIDQKRDPKSEDLSSGMAIFGNLDWHVNGKLVSD